MKQQIRHFSPHQNAKVFSVLFALSSLIMVVPMFFFTFLAIPDEAQASAFPGFLFLLFPIIYLIFGYLFIGIGCWIYNFITKFTGGIEFQIEQKST